MKPEIQQTLEKLLGRSLNRNPGYRARNLIDAADAGEVDSLICVGGNLYAANPDLTQAKRALGNIETVIYLATKPNLGHFHGLAKKNTIIVPVLIDLKIRIKQRLNLVIILSASTMKVKLILKTEI